MTGFRKRRWYTHENLGEEPLDLPPTDLQTTGYWVSLSEETVTRLREAGVWSNDPNDYGPDWPRIRDRVRARDKYTCQVCGAVETNRQHEVHHKIPFRAFMGGNAKSPDFALRDLARQQANRLENLTTLCPSCHHKAEQNVRMKSGLSGLAYVLGNLAPLFLMCDAGDLGRMWNPLKTRTSANRRLCYMILSPRGSGSARNCSRCMTNSSPAPWNWSVNVNALTVVHPA